MDWRAFPGGDLVAEGLTDLAAGRETVPAALVSVGAPRLKALGIDLTRPLIDPEHRLYEMLAAEGTDTAHGRYGALIRRLVSFERAVACAG
ncbi:MAG: hypothetical protein ABIR92_03660 [Gemmatimonadaceae bacterium]